MSDFEIGDRVKWAPWGTWASQMEGVVEQVVPPHLYSARRKGSGGVLVLWDAAGRAVWQETHELEHAPHNREATHE